MKVCELPPSIDAVVVTVGRAMAASAVKPSVEPSAPAVPASAEVVMESVSEALSVAFFVPVTTAPAPIEAVVTSVTRLIEAPAPIPTVPASESLAIAFVVLSTELVADCVRSLLLRLSPVVGTMSACVSTSAIVRAREPAMPTLPKPAPAVASVSSELLPSGSPATCFQFAGSRCGAMTSVVWSFSAT